ncbi:MAG: hypothetical protein ACMUHB_00535 [Thermoplasmatota archaeon]
MYDFDRINQGPSMDAPRRDPLREEKHRKMKATRIGLALFLGAFASYIVGIPTMIICIGFFLLLGAIGLGIAGYVMMIKGGDALQKPHKTLVILSLVIMIASIFVGVILGLVVTGMGNYDFDWGLEEKTYSGAEVKEELETLQRGVWTGIVTTILTSGAWAMLFFIPSKKWGKILIVVYVVLAILLAVTSAGLKYVMIQNEIDDIEDDDLYSRTEKDTLISDLNLRLILPGLMGFIASILLVIIAIGAYLNVKKMEQELEPKLDPRLYSINM